MILKTLPVGVDELKDDGSTITVDLESKSLPIKTLQETKRTVSFDDFSRKSYRNTIYCEEDVSQFWYGPQDYKQFKATTHFIAKQIARTESQNKAPYSFERVLVHTYQVCCKHENEKESTVLSSEENKRLRRWADMGTARLGLERWCCSSINRDKAHRRAKVVDVVLEAQRGGFPEEIDVEELIRECSQRVTRTSRLFAQCLGQAQSNVVKA